jgi:Uncharacterized lipoprotein
MRHHYLAFAFCASLLVDAGALARAASLDNIPLKWTPTSTLSEWGPIDLSGATITTKIHLDAFVDSRQNPSLVAENREHPDKVRSVTTSGDVAAFVADHLKESMRGAGLNIVDGPADVTITGDVRKFFVTEVNTYNGEIAVLIHVKNNAGKELWSGMALGDAQRWGRSYKAENYYEAMSNVVLSLTYNLLSNASFRESLAKF